MMVLRGPCMILGIDKLVSLSLDGLCYLSVFFFHLFEYYILEGLLIHAMLIHVS